MSVEAYITIVADASRAASRMCHPEDLARAESMRSARRRREFLGGRALARFAIEESAAIPAARQDIRVTPTGKPVCMNGPEFNLSHSGEWLVCVTATDGRAGVDLQFPAAHISTQAIAELYFCAEEKRCLRDADERYFYMLWALKEAHVKANGLSALDGLGSIECRVEQPTIHAVVHRGCSTRLSLYSFDSAFLALATTDRTSVRWRVPAWHVSTDPRLPEPTLVAES